MPPIFFVGLVADELFKLLALSSVIDKLGEYFCVLVALHYNPLLVFVEHKVPTNVAQGGQTLGQLNGFVANLPPTGNFDALDKCHRDRTLSSSFLSPPLYLTLVVFGIFVVIDAYQQDVTCVFCYLLWVVALLYLTNGGLGVLIVF